MSYDESLLGTLKIYRDAQNFDKASNCKQRCSQVIRNSRLGH